MKSLHRKHQTLARQLKAIGESLIEESGKFEGLHLDDHNPFKEVGELLETRTAELSGLMDDVFEFAGEVEGYNQPSPLGADFIANEQE